MIKSRIRVAVIGAGSMGKNHIRIFSQLKHVDFIGFYDLNKEESIKLAQTYDCKFFDSIEGIQSEVDAVSICTPSVTHHDVAVEFIKNGIHCLVEKPLATNHADTKNLINLAKENKVKLLVGHVEQFNPAVLQLKEILKTGDFNIHSISANRVGVGGARITDVGVIDDIMIHDIDIVLSIVNDIPKEITSQTVKKADSLSEDFCIGVLKFPSNIIADITASRITHKRNRTLEVDTDKGLFLLNYFTQELEFHYQTQISHDLGNASKLGTTVLDTRVEKVMIRRSEPLSTELAHFISIIINDEEPGISGEQALRALSVAWKIKESSNS
jgi:virulence factor